VGLIPLRLMSRAPLDSPCKIRSAWDDGYCRAKKRRAVRQVLPIPIPLSAVVKHPQQVAAPGRRK
jgi:hypothetical protein